jgi:nucleotide-binding universal stress UspA family protein
MEELVQRGNAAEQILRMAEERSADLLVIGARHSPFADGTVLGTTSIRVIRHSLVPVLSVLETAGA